MRRFLVMAAACGALVCGALAPSARADDPPSPDWKQLAYDETHTGFNPAQTAIGADNVGQLRLIWVKGPAQTIPLVEHGHVITCSAGSCYDRLLANGALVWKTQKRAHSQATTIGQGQLFSVGVWAASCGWSSTTAASPARSALRADSPAR